MERPGLHFLIAALLAVLCIPLHADASSDTAFFEAKIRPLLLERCIECHGEKKQKGGLRLDSKAAWQKGGENGAALVPGDPDASLLVKAVRRGDRELQMPPKHPLAAEEVLALEQWVKDGAPDTRNSPAERAPLKAPGIEDGRNHWAFQPVSHPAPPATPNDRWSRTDLDRFVFERLRRAGLQPSPRADKRSLLRRATFDLIGLPPSQSEVDTFEADNAPDAFAKAVDRLLASHHYGEQWARHWLDIARYSDTKGYVFGREEKRFVHAWPYRDWVVHSLNSDLPYDRFLLLQIAAEQLVPENSPDLAALGFLTLGRRFLGVTHDIIDDRIDVLMRGTQGLTAACARCHDHKFDPIPTRDYYALYGVFQSCEERVVPCEEGSKLPPAFVNEDAARRLKLRTALTLRREEQSKRTRSTIAEHLLAQLELEKYPEETFDQIISPADINPGIVRRWQSFLREREHSADNVFAAWRVYSIIPPKDFAQRAPQIHQALTASASRQLHPSVAEAFRTAPGDIKEVAQRYAILFASVDKEWNELLKKDPQAASLPNPSSEALRQILYGPEGPCFVPDEHISNIERFFPTPVVEELWKLHGEVDRWLIQSAEAPAHATILADRATPSSPRVFKRGNPLQKGETVPRQFLAVLSPAARVPFSNGSGRLELARAIASPNNPLTARVLVNRVWTHHFGRGLVPTTSDFGTRAEPPTHPELLDWLATRFIAQGWSLKQLHREIMLSAAYQQSSRTDSGSPACAKALEQDADNRLLWRMSPRRLSFEQMRDAWLAATGELDRRVGGKAVELFSANNNRRTLYAYIDRERLPDVLRVFDFANPDLSIPQRTDTVVPQQALFAMNHPFILARSTVLAALAEKRANDPAGRLAVLTSALFQRPPSPEEDAAALQLVESASAPPGQSAAKPWAQLAQALMLTNEFLFLD
jgi:cytochrome c553